ncbi:DUF4432 family protein [Halovivax sp.]|uniref:DUF4432 family protein n=1 Tax=Halovivax sp. TaxID=1935978 RepID=UPI0025C30E93|nr:DUF4432 family protein [Halovivax sp.]
MPELSVTDEYARRGIDTVHLENDRLRVEVLAGKGGDVTEIRDKRTDVNVLFETPHEWYAPAAGQIGSPDDWFTFLDHFPGGWNSVLPTAGAPAQVEGAPLAHHGESTLIPFDARTTAEDDRVVVSLSAELSRYPLRVERELTLEEGASRLEWEETVANVGEVDVDYSWVQHVALGEPLISPDARLEAPCETVHVDPHHDPDTRRLPAGETFEYPVYEGDDGEIDVSRFPPKDERVHDLAALTGFEEGRYTVTNPELDLGVTVEFDRDLYEFVWYWGAFGGFEDAPFFGRNYNLGLEPCTSRPTGGLEEHVENDTAEHLPAGETVSTALSLETHAAG